LIHNSKLDAEKDVFYVCGLFMTKTFSLEVISSYVMSFQQVIPYAHTYQKLLKLHNAKDDDGFDGLEIEKKITIGLTCGITCQQMKVPVKGRMCEHYHCFELENYLSANK
jgi:hypothetical protein